jgi:hypothetical protein
VRAAKYAAWYREGQADGNMDAVLRRRMGSCAECLEHRLHRVPMGALPDFQRGYRDGWDQACAKHGQGQANA